jgi:NitT/TauT family transport system substrate-binding protein
MKRPYTLHSLAAALLALIPLSAVLAQQPATIVTISVLKGPSGIGAAWMMSEPPATPNAEYRFVTAASADLVTAKLVSGEVQGGVLPLNVAAKLFNAGVPIKALAVVGDGMVKFLTNDSGIRRLADLKGREISIAGQKATPDYLFRFLAGKAGLESGRDYTPVYSLAYPEIAAQLAAGKLACAVLPEPFATQAMMLNKSIASPIDLDKLWTEATGLSSYPMSLFVVSGKLAGARPDVIQSIAASYRSSIAKTVADPAATARLAESLDLGMKAAVAQAAIPKSNYVYRTAADARASIEATLSLFLGEDPQSIGGKLPGADFYGK